MDGVVSEAGENMKSDSISLFEIAGVVAKVISIPAAYYLIRYALIPFIQEIFS